MQKVNSALQKFIQENIIPQYDSFDAAHQRNHVLDVIDRSLALAAHYDVDYDMVYATAAYHDTGLIKGRERHHVVSGEIIRNDKRLCQWFSQEQVEIMAQAAEDHRASSQNEPRTVYGKIVAEADRLIDARLVIRRTIQFGLSHYPELTKEWQYQRFKQHLLEKYAEGGYLKLWLPESDNAPRLEELRAIIRDEQHLQAIFEEEYQNISVRQ